MEIAVLVKPVPEAESRLRATADGRRWDTEGVKFLLAGYDESAVEQALLLKEGAPNVRVTAVSFGPAPRTEEGLRSALALGCDAAMWVEGPAESGTDPIVSARALALALARSRPDLVLAGTQAGDDEASLVPAAVAELLGLPDIGSVANLRVGADGRSVSFERAAEGGQERWLAPLPIVVGLQQAWNDPRTAKLPNILKSRRAPIARIGWEEVQSALGEAARARSEPERFELPAPRTGAKMIAYESPEEAAAELVRRLREEAKVFP